MNEQDPTGSNPPSSPESGSTGDVGGTASKDERNLALLTHILGFFTSFLGPLIIWLLKKDASKFLDHHGKQALNFQITMAIGYIIGSATTVIVIGCVILPVVFVVNIVFCIMAAMAASKGEWYRYPIAIPILK